MATVVWIRYEGVFVVFKTLTCCKIHCTPLGFDIYFFEVVKSSITFVTSHTVEVHKHDFSSFPLMHTIDLLTWTSFQPACIAWKWCHQKEI